MTCSFVTYCQQLVYLLYYQIFFCVIRLKIHQNNQTLTKLITPPTLTHNSMLKQLISTYNTYNTYNQQSQYLKQILTNSNLANLDNPEITKEIQELYNELIKIFKQHPKTGVEFLFSKLMVEDCLKLMNLNEEKEWHKPGYGLLRAIRDVLTACDPSKHKQFLQWFSKTHTRHSSYQSTLTHLTLLSSIHQHKLPSTSIPQFLSDFIITSAICIQHYLKLKSQSPKYDAEYIEYGEIIVNSTEEWVKRCYVELLRNMRIPQTEQKLTISLLNAVCDIIAALLQIQRQGNIQHSICDEILNQSYTYIKKLVNLQQFNNLYINLLRQKKFSIPQRKIVIPERYTESEVTFPKQAFAFVVFRFMDQVASIYSYAQVVRYMIPIVNQFSPFDYQIKSNVEKLFTKYVSLEQQNFQTFISSGFPLSILWFNLHHFKNNHNTIYLDLIDRVFEKLAKASPPTFVNALRLLNEIQTPGLETEKIQMIGLKLMKLQTLPCAELKLLFKAVDLSQLSQDGETLWAQVLSLSSQNNPGLKTYLQHLLTTKQLKPAFKQQLIKSLTSK